MLRERTQRRLCRVLFVAVCVLPLMACLGWAIARQTPAYQTALMAAAGDQIGLRCDWRKHTTPRPGVHELSGVNLYAEGGGPAIATANRLRIRREADRWRVAVDKLVLSDVRQASQAVGALQSQFDPLDATVTIRTLELAGAEGRAYGEVACDFSRGGGSLVVSATSDQSAASFSLSCERAKPCTLSVDTGETRLPTSWFESPLGGCESCGFSGKLWREAQAGGATGTLFVAASHTGEGPIRATWTPATITLHEAEWKQDRLERVHATIDVPAGGYVHRSLLDAASHSLGVKQTRRVAEQLNGNSLWYDRFACEVDLDASGVTLVAACGEQEGKPLAGRIAHAILQSQGEALLLEPRERLLPLTALLRTLWPESETALPATAHAARLASRLPLE